jgi:hypothetical protein
MARTTTIWDGFKSTDMGPPTGPAGAPGLRLPAMLFGCADEVIE